jgi:hypothetical protein
LRNNLDDPERGAEGRGMEEISRETEASRRETEEGGEPVGSAYRKFLE